TAENGYKAGVSGRYSSDICTDSADYVQQFRIGQAARQPAIQAPAPIATTTTPRPAAVTSLGLVTEDSHPRDFSGSLNYDVTKSLDVLVQGTGAFIGSVWGFGIGHAIQGRYMESGWMW